MSSNLCLSENLALPREAATWVISYLAKRGAGKTYNASVQAEEMLKQQIPIVVIDGMGIWWGLRVKADGKGEGYPIVVFGGEHADLPLNPEKGAEIAKAIVETNISCVLDLSGFSKYTARKIVMAFLNKLYTLNRVDRHVYIEEADLWAPQRPIGQEEAMCLSAVDNFVRRGGNHNLGVTLITQRSAVLNKDILTQSDCLVILRTLAPQDKKAIQLWVEEQTDKDKTELNQWYDSLKSLENGEAYVWHPEKPTIFQRVKYRQRETFHATREFIKSPQANKIVLMNVEDFVQKFKTAFDVKLPDSKAETTKDSGPLKERITSLEKEKETLETRIKEISGMEAERTDQLEKAQKKLERYQTFEKALMELLPKQPITVGNQIHPETLEINGATELNINHKGVAVTISHHGDEVINMSTSTKEGQMMYCIVNEMPKDEEGWSNGELIKKALEHGWALNQGTVSVSLSKWASKGLLIKATKGYRLPKLVKFDITN